MGEQKTGVAKLILNVLILIFIAIAIGTLIATIHTIIKYSDMLKNPIGYNMDKFNLKYCACINNDGLQVPILSTSSNESLDTYIPKQKEIVPISNLSNLNISIIK